MNTKFNRTAFEVLKKMKFYNIIIVFTIAFDQFNVSLLNKSINCFKKKKNLTDSRLFVNMLSNTHRKRLCGLCVSVPGTVEYA